MKSSAKLAYSKKTTNTTPYTTCKPGSTMYCCKHWNEIIYKLMCSNCILGFLTWATMTYDKPVPWQYLHRWCSCCFTLLSSTIMRAVMTPTAPPEKDATIGSTSLHPHIPQTTIIFCSKSITWFKVPYVFVLSNADSTSTKGELKKQLVWHLLHVIKFTSGIWIHLCVLGVKSISVNFSSLAY